MEPFFSVHCIAHCEFSSSLVYQDYKKCSCDLCNVNVSPSVLHCLSPIAVYDSSTQPIRRPQSLPGSVSGSVYRNQGAAHFSGEDQECQRGGWLSSSSSSGLQTRGAHFFYCSVAHYTADIEKKISSLFFTVPVLLQPKQTGYWAPL